MPRSEGFNLPNGALQTADIELNTLVLYILFLADPAQVLTLCENESITLTCPEGSVIRTQRAFYGSNSNNRCEVTTTRCQADIAVTVFQV